MKRALENLHALFLSSEDVGSLINPLKSSAPGSLLSPDFDRVSPLLNKALRRESISDPVSAVFGSAALGVIRAASLLTRRYTLVATNVPYLQRGKQGDNLRNFIEHHHNRAKSDLATAFIERCRDFCETSGAYALVSPQNWLSLRSYEHFRRSLLKEQCWQIVARLGTSAFESISGAVVNVALLIVQNNQPPEGHSVKGWDSSGRSAPSEKASHLINAPSINTGQIKQLSNPDARVSLRDMDASSLLGKYAVSLQGISPADLPRYGRYFWEMRNLGRWEFWAGTPSQTSLYSGRSKVLWWNKCFRQAVESGSAYIRGKSAWGQRGVAVGQMHKLTATLFTGNKFDTNIAVIVPIDATNLPAIWAFCSSPEFREIVREIDTSVKVTSGTFGKVPFDLGKWLTVAKAKDLVEFPEPHSNDPTQWIFRGDLAQSDNPLQVAVARLLGYHWPQQPIDRLSNSKLQDGILALSPIAGQVPAAERIRSLLSTAFGEEWSDGKQRELLRDVGYAELGLDAWLRDGFFDQHRKLFLQRPFIWHIWDGRRDGFSALVNYHLLDIANLDRLIYTYLGEWIRTQNAGQESGIPGAEGRLVAASELQRKLESIRDGEKPFDIYVRWKATCEQAIGWKPDLDDGVRLNIRPFVKAGVLRKQVNLKWNKDRGHDPDGSERINDRHLTLSEKRKAREEALK